MTTKKWIFLFALCVASRLSAQEIWLKGGIDFRQESAYKMTAHVNDQIRAGLEYRRSPIGAFNLGLMWTKDKRKVWEIGLSASVTDRNQSVGAQYHTLDSSSVITLGTLDQQTYRLYSEYAKMFYPDCAGSRKLYFGYFAELMHQRAAFKQPVRSIDWDARAHTSSIVLGVAPKLYSIVTDRFLVEIGTRFNLLSFSYQYAYTNNPALTERQKESTLFSTDMFTGLMLRINVAFRT